MTLLASRPRLSFAACAAALLLSATAEAAETRYVATYGSNSNNCTLNAPCRNLQRAVNQAPDNGEVIVLDSGHFGSSLTINKSITISADSVTATLGDPGDITIDDANAVVVLRGLHLKGAGAAGVSGIRIANAAAVHIERCTIESFSGHGIFFHADNAALFVTDSAVRNSSNRGLQATVSNARITIDNSRFERNSGGGVVISNDHQSTISRSVSSGNGGSGVMQSGGRMNVTWTTAANNAVNGYQVSNGQMTLESSVAGGNSESGLRVRNNSMARVSRSVFSHNSTGIRIDAGNTVQTYQTSVLRGNGTNLSNSGTVTTPAPF